MSGDEERACLKLGLLGGSMAVLELHNPKRRNAMTDAMWRELPGRLQEAVQMQEARSVAVAGSGEHFCAGADISELLESVRDGGDEEGIAQGQAAVAAAHEALASCPLPTIAAVHGSCFGGGLGLALCCDFRLGSQDSRYAITPARLGLAYSLADTRRLHRTVGPTLCRQLLLGARELDAGQAHAAGLLSEPPLPPKQVWPAVEQLAADLAKLSPFSQRAIKRTLGTIEGAAAADTPEQLHALALSAFTGPDMAEGTAAFVEKRPPAFRR